MILALSSDYFEQLFLQDYERDNIVFESLHPSKMELLLKYIYEGQVFVPEDIFNDFINLCSVFGIKYLTSFNDKITCISDDDDEDIEESRNIFQPSSSCSTHENVPNVFIKEEPQDKSDFAAFIDYDFSLQESESVNNTTDFESMVGNQFIIYT